MDQTFYKYQGTGNDFVIIDNRNLQFPKENAKLIEFLCDRHFGIGADGLILLEEHDEFDFKMIYFNADGNESTMCGNGGRCIVAFAHKLGLFSGSTKFIAVDGVHSASISKGEVSLQMIDVKEVQLFKNYAFTNTGSPHHVEWVENLEDYPVYVEGKRIRNELYGKSGSNVNFIEQLNDHTFKVRTYERGVEDETLACGTGVTAVAIAMHKAQKTSSTTILLAVPGGNLEVSFEATKNGYHNIFLKGLAKLVFKGSISI